MSLFNWFTKKDTIAEIRENYIKQADKLNSLMMRLVKDIQKQYRNWPMRSMIF